MSHYGKMMFHAFVLAALVFLTACSTSSPFPFRAMSGETIVIPFGNTADEIGEGATVSNLVVTLVDGGGVTHVIDGTSSGVDGQIRAVFRSYADPLSRVPENGWLDQGEGQLAAVVDLPSDLQAGAGSLVVTSSALLFHHQHELGTWGLNRFFQIEILDGVGTPHSFRDVLNANSPSVDALEYMVQLPRYKYTVNAGETNIGAVELDLRIDPAVAGTTLRMAKKYEPIDTNMMWSSVSEVDGTLTYRAVLTNANGGGADQFTSYLLGDELASMDLAGIINSDGVGNLSADAFSVFDVAGNEIVSATVTIESFN